MNTTADLQRLLKGFSLAASFAEDAAKRNTDDRTDKLIKTATMMGMVLGLRDSLTVADRASFAYEINMAQARLDQIKKR